MSSAHAPYLADQAVSAAAEIIENVELARDTWRVRFRFPELARRVTPGQFVMLRLAGYNDPLLGRPLAVYDVTAGTDGQPRDVDVVYLVKGKLTSRLCNFLPGQTLEVWGPLGNGFLPTPTDHLIMVAGGIGQTPFLALAKEYLGKTRYGLAQRAVPRANRVTFCYGARTKDYFAGVDDFVGLGVDVRLATDDGSHGRKGFVTDLLRDVLKENSGTPRIVCCGPEPMMEAVAHIAAEHQVPCQVSLETPMACGVGICFTCVARIKEEDGTSDYRRTCVEGPVFDAACIEW
ncbi:dihydroorotate dehydrogenase electron transfer subunit [Anatilimnocola floriformis]|uniref:dihydroorotate dehydrogenase electron transfer subunit n=1 Tax=Anatilimnocola floriformis TaxID=2948575 RepID=UPI0020C40A87|nr:dihydroorotate dehydrogenase electron transfer subunit [Anatilimnocola floriformis]